MTNKLCPFCGDREAYPGSGGVTVYWCGTYGPDENGEYETGTLCGKTCFRNAFLRCHDLLVRIVDGATQIYGNGSWTISTELMDAILAELKDKEDPKP
jgi:hypothetical protein